MAIFKANIGNISVIMLNQIIYKRIKLVNM